jgi:branched-chain amino acid transport system ATP-binding protein
MLALGRALMSRPRVLILDEPSLGLAPIAIRVVYDALRQIRDDGTGLLLIEQSSRLVATIASRVHFVTRGEVSPAVSPGAIESYAREHYLGTRRQDVRATTDSQRAIG